MMIATSNSNISFFSIVGPLILVCVILYLTIRIIKFAISFVLNLLNSTIGFFKSKKSDKKSKRNRNNYIKKRYLRTNKETERQLKKCKNVIKIYKNVLVENNVLIDFVALTEHAVYLINNPLTIAVSEYNAVFVPDSPDEDWNAATRIDLSYSRKEKEFLRAISSPVKQMWQCSNAFIKDIKINLKKDVPIVRCAVYGEHSAIDIQPTLKRDLFSAAITNTFAINKMINFYDDFLAKYQYDINEIEEKVQKLVTKVKAKDIINKVNENDKINFRYKFIKEKGLDKYTEYLVSNKLYEIKRNDFRFLRIFLPKFVFRKRDNIKVLAYLLNLVHEQWYQDEVVRINKEGIIITQNEYFYYAIQEEHKIGLPPRRLARKTYEGETKIYLSYELIENDGITRDVEKARASKWYKYKEEE